MNKGRGYGSVLRMARRSAIKCNLSLELVGGADLVRHVHGTELMNE
jgi:hypothetical protein